MPNGLIAITGSTGRLGGRVARRLAAQGVAQRLVVREAARAPRLPATEVRIAAYGERAAMEEALAGVQTLFFVSAAEAPNRVTEHFTLIDAAVAAGVQRVVYTSVMGAAAHATFTLSREHWATEQRLAERGLAGTVLRDNFYLDFLPALVGKDDVIRGPAGEGRVAAVALDDVADVASAVLLDPEAHLSRTYNLTGREALSMAEVASTLSQRLGRAIRYHAETVEEAYQSRAGYGAAQWQLDAWVSTYTAFAAGELASLSRDVEKLVGRPPLRLADLEL